MIDNVHQKIKALCAKRVVAGRDPGLVVMGGDSCSEGHGFDS